MGPDGSQIGIRSLPEALALAREVELDLVEVADKANPPVARIMDYGKYKYEAAQRAKESRKHQASNALKEMKYRPKIGKADFETKTRNVERFLGEGHKVKITIMFRGREIFHPEIGRKILDDVAASVANVGRVEVASKLDGRNMTMVLAPDKKAQAAFQSQLRKVGAEAAAAEHQAGLAELSEIVETETEVAEAETETAAESAEPVEMVVEKVPAAAEEAPAD